METDGNGWKRMETDGNQGMSTEAEIRVTGMQALVGALGLVDAGRFMAATSRDRFNYTEWRRLALSDMSLQDLAAAANQVSTTIAQPDSN